MRSEHLLTRSKLKEIPKRSTFNELLDDSTLDDIDKEILRFHYLGHKDFSWIGDELGYAEVTIKKRHSRALNKLRALLI